MYSVKYEDGNQEQNVDETRIKLRAEETPPGKIYINKELVKMEGAWLDKVGGRTEKDKKAALLQGLAAAALRAMVKFGDDERMRREAKAALPVVAQGRAAEDIRQALERIDLETESAASRRMISSFLCREY